MIEKSPARDKAINEILVEMSATDEQRAAVLHRLDVIDKMYAESLHGQPTRNSPDPTVEAVPGVMVSQRLIDEAVRLTSNRPVSEDDVEAIARKHLDAARAHEEIKQDISTSKQIVQSMFDRAREPVNPDEKYVSYDSMPAPLQRVVKAYIDVSTANKELDEAIKGLQQVALAATS